MKVKLIAPARFAWLISARKTGVPGAGLRKENAIKTVQFVPAYTWKENTVLIVIPFPAKDSCGWTHGTGKNMAWVWGKTYKLSN